MLTLVGKTLALLDRRERWRLIGLAPLMVLMALVQMVGVASILPFMSMVTNPALIHENRWMSALYESLAFSNPRDFLVFSGIVVLALIALGNAVSALTTWAQLRFAWGTQYALSVRLLERYLNEPYSYYLGRNTSRLAKNVLAEAKEVVNGVIVPGLRVVAKSIVTLALLTLLVLVDPRVALVAGCLFSGAFGLIYLLIKRKQARLGRVRNRMNTERYRVSTEALAGIKDTKVLGREREFLARFMTPARRYSDANASNAIISEIPKYVLETLAFGGILVLVLYQLTVFDDVAQVIGIMSLYALAGYRLMPSLQAIFNGFAKIRFFRPILNDLHADLTSRAAAHALSPATAEAEPEPLALQEAITVDGVWFRYLGREEYVARDLHLRIPRNATIGFVGSTGSGKTTLVDIMLGLLEPERGSIRVDGVPLGSHNLREWRKNVGYVPQSIYLCDNTIAQNIAFGLPDDRIDHSAVERAARIASMHDFVTALPDGYDTVVGDRGVRLSGGQRQRIGIARALYHDPDVLIMDEATSALDGATENAVMTAIDSLTGRKTIILVAHRLTTVRDCDTIYLFDGGRISASGTYDELVVTSTAFRTMARVGLGDAIATR